ncbi:MAG: YicC family protein [Verrucomicrobiae bacterium]|nr:YicC family protein [Verrucomicrobiae bacterium]MCX7722374.1 YicC family protein [Verrucomicrobiae bacterium]MDW7980388.1 YicC/YloC family endoribonuclease [Verrucomicrobiales bacterium]
MKSMTGYGRGECARDGYKVTVEVSSVNRKQAEITVTLPRELEVLEPRVRDMVNQYVSRGRLTVRVTLQTPTGKLYARAHLNKELARVYAAELRKLARELGLPDAITLDHVLRAPGVFQTSDELGDAEYFWPAVSRALRAALVALVRMREREGAHLARDLAKRVALMRKCFANIARRAPSAVARYRQQLLARIKSAGLDSVAQDDRLLKEVVLFADRSDITEELTRLDSHFKQIADCLRSRAPVGRMLDFIAQEMNREVNTIGAKASDTVIVREVVKLRTELDKFREQVQNVE